MRLLRLPPVFTGLHVDQVLKCLCKFPLILISQPAGNDRNAVVRPAQQLCGSANPVLFHIPGDGLAVYGLECLFQ